MIVTKKPAMHWAKGEFRDRKQFSSQRYLLSTIPTQNSKSCEGKTRATNNENTPSGMKKNAFKSKNVFRTPNAQNRIRDPVHSHSAQQ